jgi:hypothetical protein
METSAINPEPPCLCVETEYHARHQIADDDQVRDTDAEALYSDGAVEDDGQVRIGELRQREEGGLAALEISRASGLQVEAEGGRETGPADEDYSEGDAHFRHDGGHGKRAGTDN